MTTYKPEGMLMDTAENKAFLRTRAGIAEALSLGKILEARAVLCDVDHNLVVDLGCMKGLIPREEGAFGIIEGLVRDIAIISRVNKPVCFCVTGFSEDSQGQEIALLSRRRAQVACIEEYLSFLRPGDVINAQVTHLEPFGCFVDIGCGMASLLPIDLISVSRISHPKDRFKQGQNIKVIVKESLKDGKIALSHKELLGTWEENAALLHPGQTVSGIVRSVENYGIFVELLPNLAGLAEPREGVSSGQHASVYIKSIIPEKMKVKLIIVDAFDAQYSPTKVEYFFKGEHMDEFVYSPQNCPKQIKTVFGQE